MTIFDRTGCIRGCASSRSGSRFGRWLRGSQRLLFADRDTASGSGMRDDELVVRKLRLTVPPIAHQRAVVRGRPVQHGDLARLQSNVAAEPVVADEDGRVRTVSRTLERTADLTDRAIPGARVPVKGGRTKRCRSAAQ